ncbi:MAG: hypothetical protein IJ819_08970 [Clostridiales bacterium]|nr:hypothetical protein [Clostridiales bacterium]
MKSKNSSSKPLYERPGRLSAGRNVPAAPKAPNEDLRLKVHYDGEEEIPDPVNGTTAEFTSGSLNALNPFEDEALLSGEVKPRNTGRLTGAEPIRSQIFEAEADFDEEEDSSVFARDGHKFKMNSDLMAGGAEPVHARSAFNAGKPSFFTDADKLQYFLVILGFIIVIELSVLIVLLR